MPSASADAATPALSRSVAPAGKSRRFRIGLRTYLRTLFLGTITPLVVLAAVLVYQVVANERQAVHQSMLDVARTLSAAVDAEVGRTVLALEVLAMSRALDAPNLDEFRREAEAVRARHQRWSNVGLVRLDGKRLLNLQVPLGAPIPSGNAEAFLRAAAEEKTLISNVIKSPTSGKHLVYVSVPVLRNGKPLYALAATMEYDVWTEWLRSHIPPGSIAAIDDRNGTIFARSERPEAFTGQGAAEAVKRAYSEGIDGLIKAANREGLEIYAAFHTSELTGWHALIVSPAAVVDAPVDRYVVSLAAGTLLVLLLAIAASKLVARPLESSTARLHEAIAAFGEGRRPEERHLPIAELDDVHRSARQAAALLERAQQSLRHRTRQFEALLNSAPIGVCLVDSAFRITAVNPAARSLMGPPNDVDDNDFRAVLRRIVGSGAEQLTRCLENTLASGETSHLAEVPAVEQGRIHEWHMERLPLPDGHGVVCYFKDISPQVQAREEVLRQREELQTMLDVIPVGIAVAHDNQASRITVSPYLGRLLGISPGRNASLSAGDPAPPPYRCLRNGQELASDELPMQVAARTGKEVWGTEYDIELADGQILHVMSNAAPLFSPDGRVRGAIGAHVDITELKEAQLALEAADRQKNEFLVTLAHELRNPLAPIRYAAALLRSDADAGALERARQTIERQTSHLARLLDDILDLSRISRNVIELKHEAVDMVQLLRAAAENIRSLVEERRQSLLVDLGIDSLWVNGDSARLLQVVDNVLNNACKYTEPGGTIRLQARADGGHCEVRVSDTGVGLSADMVPAIFTMFGQGHPMLKASKGGLGIGLALVRRLVDLHAGSITAESPGLGRGTTFTIRLPLLEGARGSRAPSPTTSVSGADLGRLSVLVVDDNVDAARTLGMVLSAAGVSVQIAHTAAEAVSVARSWRPQAALLDVGLPDGSGNDVARSIRAETWGQDMLLVAVTGWGQQSDKESTAAAGFDMHLVKPVDPAQILALLTGFARRPARAPEVSA
jgi:signal transduction histidine kinase/ActR/RegA family two-component response regulator